MDEMDELRVRMLVSKLEARLALREIEVAEIDQQSSVIVWSCD